MARKRMGKPNDAKSLVAPEILTKFLDRIENPISPPRDSELLIELLNGDKLTGAGRERATRVLTILQTRQEYMPRLIKGEFGKREHFEVLVGALLGDALELNELLSRYQISPQIDPIGLSPKIYFYAPPLTTGEEAERAAVMSVLHLAELGELGNVRLCFCGKLFWAKRNDQRHCSTNCRVKEHQSSEKFKAKRRISDRKRYQLHRDGMVKEITRRKKHGAKKTR